MKIYIAGHLCIDEVILDGKVLPISMGGTAAFSSIVSSRLIFPERARIISKIGPDFPEQFLSRLETHNISTEYITQVKRHSTRYVLNYTNDERELTLKSVCAPITWDDFPADVAHADLIYFGPIANEIPLETIITAREETSAVIALDIQGLIRRREMDDALYFQSSGAVEEALSHADIVKFDLAEAQVVTGASKLRDITTYLSNLGLELFIITKGRKGALLFMNGKIIKIPPILLKRVYNTTGAGDCFFSSFLVEYLRIQDPFEAILFATKTTSYLIGSPKGLGSFRGEGDFRKILEEFIEQNRA